MGSLAVSASHLSASSGRPNYETSLEIAKWELSEGMTVSKMALATGTGYYDALSGAALCGRNNSVLVIASDYNRVCITDLIGRNQGAVAQGFVLGGGDRHFSVNVERAVALLFRLGFRANTMRRAVDCGAPHLHIYLIGG